MNTPEASYRVASQNLPLYFLFFSSGVAGLIYEVLWMKELGFLFGNTAYAVATTLTVFFLGLSTGGYIWGRRSKTLPNPLKTYAFLEFGIAVTAGLYFFILRTYRAVYSPLFDLFSNMTFVFILVKLILALGILFLPAFFMGGTLPIMGQHIIRRTGDLAEKGTFLYAINTVGAATGAFLAGFILPHMLGLKISYFVAIGTNVLIGVIALTMSRLAGPGQFEYHPSETVRLPDELPAVDRYSFLEILAFTSPIKKRWAAVLVALSVLTLAIGASLKFPVKEVTVCEIMPEVVDLSRKYFKPYINGLFENPRVEIVIEDGRNYLLGTDKTYDLIVADLFLPYKAGVGSLYTTDHFKSVKSRLNPGGIFVQWLSIHQFSQEELEILARTFLNVFDQVTIWRADFSPYLPFIAVVCHKDPQILDAEALTAKAARFKLFDTYKNTFGNVSGSENTSGRDWNCSGMKFS